MQYKVCHIGIDLQKEFVHRDLIAGIGHIINIKHRFFYKNTLLCKRFHTQTYFVNSNDHRQRRRSAVILCSFRKRSDQCFHGIHIQVFTADLIDRHSFVKDLGRIP